MQEVIFENDGTLSFALDEHPVLGMGEGGPRPEKDRPWGEQPVQFDCRGVCETMEPRWHSDTDRAGETPELRSLALEA